MILDDKMTVKYEAAKEECDSVKWNLIGFNIGAVGPKLNVPPFEYNAIIRNEKNEIVAGILTTIFLKEMSVDSLWINERLQNQKIGSELLESAE